MRHYVRVEEDIRQTEVARAVSFHSVSIVLDDALSHKSHKLLRKPHPLARWG